MNELNLGALAERLPKGFTTRFAPAPTGYLHLGHVVNALVVWHVARTLGGRVLLRIEDHDRARCRAEFEDSIREDLRWLGFEPDAEPAQQSKRGDRYQEALDALGARGLVYPCDCSRRDIAQDVDDVFGQESQYPGRCRSRGLGSDATPARRIRMDDGDELFHDAALGEQRQAPARQCGDMLARDRAGQWTYQFAVTVDDLDQDVGLVIRGADLLTSTGRQLRLARLLGRERQPVFLHHALLTRPDGAKLSKSTGDTGVRDLRAAGKSAEEVRDMAARAAGLDWL